MTPKKFELLEDRFEHKAGTICYECHMANYGLVRDDEWATGAEHLFMTLDPNHGYPGFTVPAVHVREVRE